MARDAVADSVHRHERLRERAMKRSMRSLKTALVLSGGGARGAYEAGVVRYLREELPRRLGYMPRLDVICGTSVGAINGAFLTATADDPTTQARRLCESWRGLRIEEMFEISLREIARATRLLLGGEPPAPTPGQLRRGGMLNTSGLERMVVRSIPWRKIQSNVAAGHVDALSVSATHVATGKTVVFVERRGGVLPPWSRDPAVRAEAAQIGPFHVLASAAIPVLFPAVAVGDAYFSDGGLRQNTPLSPALRLGADRILVISLKHIATPTEEARQAARNVEAFPSPWFLVGKSLNALLLDHTDYDIDRMHRMNAIIDGGVRAFGDRFLDELNRTMVEVRGQGVRLVHPLLVRPSEDIGRMAADYAHSPRLRSLPGLHGRLIRLAAGTAGTDADLLSYLMFDGQYAAELIEMGHRDARAREEEICGFFGSQEALSAML
jgi:NTE family protein